MVYDPALIFGSQHSEVLGDLDPNESVFPKKMITYVRTNTLLDAELYAADELPCLETLVGHLAPLLPSVTQLLTLSQQQLVQTSFFNPVSKRL